VYEFSWVVISNLHRDKFSNSVSWVPLVAVERESHNAMGDTRNATDIPRFRLAPPTCWTLMLIAGCSELNVIKQVICWLIAFSF
jgi:hypothetical protein